MVKFCLHLVDLKKTIMAAFVLFFFSACDLSAQEQNTSRSFSFHPDVVFFVSPDGNDIGRQAGADIRHPFKTIGKAAEYAVRQQRKNPDLNFKIWVKAGVYKESVNLDFGPGPRLRNTVFEGYREHPGDIDPERFVYKLGDKLDPLKMPLLDGDKSRAKGIFLKTSNNNITIRNFQIENYKQKGVLNEGQFNSFENIIVYSVTGKQGSFGGVGIGSIRNKNRFQNCIVGNCWGAGIGITGNQNFAKGCIVYCNENATDNGTDYYFLVQGEENEVVNCVLQRSPTVKHLGHGFMVRAVDKKDSKNNRFRNCVSNNVQEAYHVMGQASTNPTPKTKLAQSTHNTFEYCEANKGSVYLGWESGLNRFFKCQIKGGSVGVRFANWTDGERTPSQSNTFTKCKFKDLETFVDFSIFWDRSSSLIDPPVEGNVFEDCVFENGYSLLRTQRPNRLTVFKNSKFSRVVHLLTNGGLDLDAKFENCEFSDIGFDVPNGIGNVGKRSSKFPPEGDIESGLIGHWKFDEKHGKTAKDESSNGFDGRLEGTANWKLNGKLGSCAELNEDSKFIVEGDLLNAGERPLTIAAWINARQWKGYIVQKWGKGVSYGGGNYRFALTRRENGAKGFDNHLNVQARRGATNRNTATTGIRQLSNDFTRMYENQWYHVAVVIESGDGESRKWKLYVDGILRNKTELAIERDQTKHPLEIGGGFSGLIDDVRIYDRALDKFDIRTLANFRENSRNDE